MTQVNKRLRVHTRPTNWYGCNPRTCVAEKVETYLDIQKVNRSITKWGPKSMLRKLSYMVICFQGTPKLVVFLWFSFYIRKTTKGYQLKTYIYIQLSTFTYTYIHIYIYIHITYMYIYIYIIIYVYTSIQTHTRTYIYNVNYRVFGFVSPRYPGLLTPEEATVALKMAEATAPKPQLGGC